MSTNVCGLRSNSGNQRALHLDHDPVAGAERVVAVPSVKLAPASPAPGTNGSGFRKAVAELAAHDVAGQEHLVAAHPHARADWGRSGQSPGYTSISFTTQSASVPVVETCRLASIGPAMVTSSVEHSVR